MGLSLTRCMFEIGFLLFEIRWISGMADCSEYEVSNYWRRQREMSDGMRKKADPVVTKVNEGTCSAIRFVWRALAKWTR